MFRLSFDWEILENVKEQLFVFIPMCAGLSLDAQTSSCVCSLDSCVRRLVLTCVYLFFYLGVCRFDLAYACRILHMQDPSYACMAPGRNPNLGILDPLSSVFHLFVILTSSFIIFALNCMPYVFFFHPIVNPISLSHHSFLLITILIPFSSCRFQPHILVREVPVGSWCGTTSLLRRLGDIFVLWVLSPLSFWCLRGLLVLSWHRPWSRGGGIPPTPSISGDDYHSLWLPPHDWLAVWWGSRLA